MSFETFTVVDCIMIYQYTGIFKCARNEHEVTDCEKAAFQTDEVRNLNKHMPTRMHDLLLHAPALTCLEQTIVILGFKKFKT